MRRPSLFYIFFYFTYPRLNTTGVKDQYIYDNFEIIRANKNVKNIHLILVTNVPTTLWVQNYTQRRKRDKTFNIIRLSFGRNKQQLGYWDNLTAMIWGKSGFTIPVNAMQA
jgi:hypothetical protein